MSSSDVFGSENFEDILAAVDSLETREENEINRSLSGSSINVTDEFSVAQSYIADIRFDNPAKAAVLFDSALVESLEGELTSELPAHESSTLLDPDALYGELQDNFDGVAAANEIATLFFEDQSVPVRNVTAQFVDETLAVREITDNAELEMPTAIVSETPAASLLDKPTRKSLARKISLYNFSRRFPNLYLAIAGVMAGLGFAYILVFPALFALATLNGFEMLNNPFTQNSISLIVSLFSISLFLFLISYKLFNLKFVIPESITLDETNASHLMEKLQSLKKEHRIPKIDQVILTRRHELNIIKIPRFGLPIWSRNILAIGYPLLQTLSPEYFDSALSRRLLQYAKHRGLIVNWLSFMRKTWTLYAASLKQRNGVTDLIHYCFFAPYASLYRRFAVYITQLDELKADELALASVNDRDLLKSAQTLRITQAMLFQYYWPKLNNAIQNNLSSPANIRPYFNLPATLADLLNNENVDAWFIRLSQEDVNELSAEAPFAKRMEQMGHSKVSVPKAFAVSAAHHYFASQYETMTDHMDELWAEEVQKALLIENLKSEGNQTVLPFRLSIQPA